MTNEQAERAVQALEKIAKSTEFAAVMLETQLGAIGYVQRRLAELTDVLEKKKPKAR